MLWQFSDSFMHAMRCKRWSSLVRESLGGVFVFPLGLLFLFLFCCWSRCGSLLVSLHERPLFGCFLLLSILYASCMPRPCPSPVHCFLSLAPSLPVSCLPPFHLATNENQVVKVFLFIGFMHWRLWCWWGVSSHFSETSLSLLYWWEGLGGWNAQESPTICFWSFQICLISNHEIIFLLLFLFSPRPHPRVLNDPS